MVPVGAALPVCPVTVAVIVTAAVGEVEAAEEAAVVVEGVRLLPETEMVSGMTMEL